MTKGEPQGSPFCCPPEGESGGTSRVRTGVRAFAELCLTTRPSRPYSKEKRDLAPFLHEIQRFRKGTPNIHNVKIRDLGALRNQPLRSNARI